MAELSRFDGTSASQGRGWVAFEGDASLGARLALAARVPVRVVLDVGRTETSAPAEVRDSLADIEWERLLPRNETWAVRAIGRSDELRHSGFVEQLVKDGVLDRFRGRGLPPPEVDPRAPRVLIDARVSAGGVLFGIDLLGSSLHRRGSARRGEAPLREDVAAGLAYLARVSDAEQIVDPFCGTGTLILEAASVALGLPVARDSRTTSLAVLPGFSHLPLRDLSREPLSDPREVAVLASDESSAAVAETRRVAAIQGLGGVVSVEQRGISDLPALEPGSLLLSNPPWGRRLDLERARAAWHELGRVARTQCRGSSLALLSGDREITRELGLRASRRFPVRLGPVDARLLIYPIEDRRPPGQATSTEHGS